MMVSFCGEEESNDTPFSVGTCIASGLKPGLTQSANRQVNDIQESLTGPLEFVEPSHTKKD